MTTINTQHLTGLTLDWAVSQAEGLRAEIDDYMGHKMIHVFNGPEAKRSAAYSPSGWWSYGGPIIEREITEFHREPGFGFWAAADRHSARGPTLLIAAMRAYVLAKLGATVDVPDELVA